MSVSMTSAPSSFSPDLKVRSTTRAVVKVPLFIEQGEVIRVDTRSGEYVSRVKE